jgi:predicted RNA methylase
MIRRIFISVIKPPYTLMRSSLVYLIFERRYGVTTEGVISRADLGYEGEERRRYRPAGITSLRRILRRNEVGPDDVFIDFGSGMGRVVLQAALMYPFQRVIGVELAVQLHEIAEVNIERNRDHLVARDIVLVNADVLDYEIPDDVTVAFFNNPFVGYIFQVVIDRLLASVDRNPRSLRIIYGNPVEESVLLSTGRVKPVRTLRGLRPTRQWSDSNAFRMYSVIRSDTANPSHLSNNEKLCDAAKPQARPPRRPWSCWRRQMLQHVGKSSRVDKW